MKPMAHNKSRAKGHQYERKLMSELKALGWENCMTSRYESKRLDDAMVDFVHTDPFNIQAKAWERAPSYHDVLDGMPKDSNINIIVHKRNRNGEVVVMTKDDFYRLIGRLIQLDGNFITK